VRDLYSASHPIAFDWIFYIKSSDKDSCKISSVNTVVTYQSFGYGPLMKVVKFLTEVETHPRDNIVLLANLADKHIIEPNSSLLAV
jgi:hypothetical protein